MKNFKGQTVKESIEQELKMLNLLNDRDANGKAAAFELRGKINTLVEFGLITEAEWSEYIIKIFAFLHDE